MKRLWLAAAAVVCCLAGALRADDVAEAQKAFDLFRQYTRTSDAKLLDLFAPDISVTLSAVPAKGPSQDMVLPPAEFLAIVKSSLATKEGSADTYEDLKFAQEGSTVRLTCTRTDGRTGVVTPFLIIYGKDDAGRLKIKAMRIAEASEEAPGVILPSPAPPTTDVPVPKATP